MREKIGQNILPREDSLFFKSLVLDFLGPKEMIISLAQYLSKNLVYSYKLFPEVFHARYYQEKWAKNFCHRENLYFFKRLFLSIP